MLLSSVINKGGSFIAQIVLGWLLFEEDFGLYAIAISIASLVQIFRDGGTRKIVVQRGQRHFARLCPSVFWMATTFNVAAAALLALGAYPASLLYEEPRLFWMIMILSLSCLVGTPDTMYRAWLSVQLRFRELARINLIVGLVRSGSMILLAVLGAEAQSFVWPAVIVSASGWVMGRVLCGPLPLSGRVRLKLGRVLLHSSVWLILGSGAMIMTRQGPYMVLGLFHDPAVIGIYFFAFQLLMQLNQLLAANIQSVLLPALSSVQRNSQRHADAVIRSSQAMMFLSVGFAMGLSVGLGDLIRFVWGDKWVAAIPAVLWMGLFFPTRMLLNVFEPAMQSRGKYKDWALISVLQSSVVAIATLLVSVFTNTPGEFAMGIGLALFISMLLGWFIGLPRIGVSSMTVSSRCLPIYFLGVIAYGVVLLARKQLGLETMHSRPSLALHGFGSAIAFALLFVGLVRVLVPSVLHQTIDMVPHRFARPARVVFRLRIRS